MRDLLKFYRLSDAIFYDHINTLNLLTFLGYKKCLFLRNMKDQQRTDDVHMIFFPWFFIKAYIWVLIPIASTSRWIQIGNHNICLYKEVDKKYTGCNLKTTELLNPSPANSGYTLLLQIWICTVCHLVCEFIYKIWIKQSDWLTIRSGSGILIYSAWQGLTALI